MKKMNLTVKCSAGLTCATNYEHVTSYNQQQKWTFTRKYHKAKNSYLNLFKLNKWLQFILHCT